MKIYNKPTAQDPRDRLLEDVIKEENTTLYDSSEEWLDRLLKESKIEYDETWMAEAESHIPAGMEERLQATIDRLAKEETEIDSSVAPIIRMTPQQQTRPPRTGLRFWTRIAACVAIILAIGVGFNMQGSNNAFADTCQTPEEVEAQLERAFAMLGRNREAFDSADEKLQSAEPSQRTLSKFITIQN